MRKIIWMGAHLLLGVFIAWWLVRSPQVTQAAVFWGAGHSPVTEAVLSRDISVCFVGTAVTTRADRVEQIVDYIHEFEVVANIHFLTVGGGVPLTQAVQSNIGSLKCPASTTPPGVTDNFPGDIRVLIPGVGVAWTTAAVPGTGCPMTSQPGSSWGTEPWLRDDRQPCMYNLKLGDDDEDFDTGLFTGTPWLNHTLHEFGHSLGLAHEHARADKDPDCLPSGHPEENAITQGYMTPYDKDSVMHYKFRPNETPSCSQIGTNYSNSGFTHYDRLALHILYPEDVRVAEFVGTTVIRDGEQLNLRAAWMAQGAYINVVAKNFLWKINGVTVSTGPTLTTTPPGVGKHTLEFSYDDLIGRSYYYSGTVRMLDVDDYDARIAGPIATNLPLVYPNFFYNPTIDLSMQPDDHMAFNFPGGLFNQSVVIDYAAQPPQNVQARAHVGLFYDLQATNLGDGQPAQIQAGQTYSVTATYDDTAVLPGTNEADLGLFYWDGDTWVFEESTVVNVNANQVMATPNHLSLWAVLDKDKLFLPHVVR